MIKHILAHLQHRRKEQQESQAVREYWREYRADALACGLFPQPKPCPVPAPRKGWIDGGGR